MFLKGLLSTLVLLVPTLLLAQSISLYERLSALHDQEEYGACLTLEAPLLELIGNRRDSLAANVFFYLADANLKKGHLTKSISYYERARHIRKELLPDGAEDYSFILFNLTSAYFEAGNFQFGKETGQQLIDFDKRTYGVRSEQYLNSVFKYVDVLIRSGEITLAEQKLEHAIRETPDFAGESGALLSKLADLSAYSGKYRKAERLFFDALERLRISDGDGSEIYNITLSNYASLLMQQAKYDQAEELFTKILESSRDKEWFTSETYYATVNNLALVYQSLGQYAASEDSYAKLIRIDSATIGFEHPDFSVTLSNLGLLYIDEGKLTDAEKVLRQSIQILNVNKETNSVSHAKKLNNLAKTYTQQGKFDDAVLLQQKALRIFEKQFGKQSPDYAIALFNLGTTFFLANSPKALSTLKSSLAILEKVLGKTHPKYAECEERIAQYYWKKKNRVQAVTAYKNVFENYFGQIENYFPVLTEEEKSNFFYKKLKPSIEGFATFTVGDPTDHQSVSRLYDYHLHTKGLILFATEKVRQSILSGNDSELISLYEKWENTKDVLTYYYSVHESQRLIDSVLRVSNEQEKLLARKSAAFAKNVVRTRVSWKSIQEKLKPGEAVLECIRYRVFNLESAKFTDEVRYAFLLLTSASKEAPVVISFEKGNDMEGRFLSYYRNGIRLKLDDLYTYKNYWEPVQDQLVKHNVTKIFFSPDGVYNIININSIKNPFTNRYLIEELDIHIVTSSRSLLEQPKNELNNRTGYLFGFPAYNIRMETEEENAWKPSVSGSGRSFRGGMMRFIRDGNGITPLPGTKLEVEQIAIALKGKLDLVEVNIEANAMESAVKSMVRPSHVHIATHGFFLEDDDDETTGQHIPNPLFMSGLILAGAENFIRTGHNPVHEIEDGILTAYEAMNLNLSGTKLVVLSACETGLGKINPGEGVYGLQRAFQVAGAESIIMSLWSVDDTATQLLMKSFYEYYFDSNDLNASFRKAQENLRQKYPEPFYWGAFILVGKGN